MKENEPLIPRPELLDEIPASNGERIQLTRDNCTIVVHSEKQYSEFNHLHIKKLGEFGIKLFAIDPWLEHLLERGYDVLIKEYPDDLTVAMWLNMQKQRLDKELGGAGGELEE